MLGGASVVALGESDHGWAEPLEFRNRFFRYLVEEKGFTAVAIESGIVESQSAYRYVRGGGGNLSRVLAKGIGWDFHRYPQNRSLLNWLRDYNSNRSDAQKVNFYGFDVSGSPGDPWALRGVGTALRETLEYLACVDRRAANAFRFRVRSFVPNLHFDIRGPRDEADYSRLSQTDRDSITAIIADLVDLLEQQERRYIAASSVEDYEWAHRAAISARQVDGWLRCVPTIWNGSVEQLKFLERSAQLRDRAQADNLDWIVKREEKRGKTLVFAHNAHVSSAQVTWRWWTPSDAYQGGHVEAGSFSHDPAGTYLRRRFGDQLITIGNLIGDSGERDRMQEMSDDAVDRLFHRMGIPGFLLDLRTAPPAQVNWLDRPRRLGRGFRFPQKCMLSFEFCVGRAFDVLLYLQSASAACGQRVARA